MPVVHYEGKFRLARRVRTSIMYPANGGLPGTTDERLPLSMTVTCVVGGEIVVATQGQSPAADPQPGEAEAGAGGGERGAAAAPPARPLPLVVYQQVPDTAAGGVYVDVHAGGGEAASALCTVVYTVIDG